MPVDPGTNALLHLAARDTGRSVADILADHAILAKGPGRLRLEDYLRNGLHVPGRYSASEREDFITGRLHWPIVTRCCDMSWYAAVDDKWLCETLLIRADLPVPLTVAVVDRSQRLFPGTPTLRNAADLGAFLSERQGRPFFGKPIRGVGGRGAFLCEGIEGNTVHIRGYDPLSVEAFFDGLGNTPYLFQEVVRNHPDLLALAPHLATVRLIVFVYDDMVTLAFAVLKVPDAENIIDSPLTAGNLVCDVADPEGTIRSVVASTPTGRVTHTAHPRTGQPMVGMTLPFWPEVRHIAAQAAAVFAPLRYQSLDVAITAEGPVIVEVNAGGSYGMIQRATQKGFLQPHVRHFLNVCGIDLAQLGDTLDSPGAQQ
ncbi:MAG: sugar-transfer associated ATP-grasp domain-containing protein [Gemmobacter sp.]|nr:sugar-transfer associated ATP-grasp domain-containing protein [Gemmobacter sp.]